MTEAIKKIIEDVLKAGDLSFEEINLHTPEYDDMTWFQIRTNDSHSLIGKNGETLSALNHLIKKIADKQKGDSPTILDFFIDVNDFQKKKVDSIKTVAHMMAERARFFKSSVDVDPMSPFERKVMHSYLSKHSDIKTESEGTGPKRHIVIRYVENKDQNK
ncbi:MAG: single-stranded nucleic acid binding spoIIIJ-associated protein [Candidatus Parcubacteria bacterium]|jgi:spoIIIJ-associated protein